MQTIIRSAFTTVKTEGGLLPADLLQRVAGGSDLPGLRPADYHLYEGERINEAVNHAWNRCAGAWKGFREQSEKLPATDSGTTLTRERWLLVLFQELGFGRLSAARGGITVGETNFPVSHLWQATPIHLVTFRQELDKRSEVSTAVKRSPHSLMQELLNRSPEHRWGVISNGLQLRILRDNASLRRAAFVEFDLAAIMQYELYAEFALLWMVCHQSRFEPFAESSKAGAAQPGRGARAAEEDEGEEAPEAEPERAATTCWLEVWSKTAAEHGTRALDALRDGVKEAIEALGTGFLAQRSNEGLADKLRAGTLGREDYYRQLRRLVYRLIFLAVAEDRDLLLVPTADGATRQLYNDYYSLQRLRRMAGAVRGGPHPDHYRQLRLLFEQLRKGYPGLGLPGLGSFLFSERSTPDLDGLDLANADLLRALRALSYTAEGGVRRPVDFRNLDSEELGSVYESLLELHPEVNTGAGTFALNQGAGSERKTTGSHYTPTPLVESLLDTALEPVVADRLAQAEERWRVSGERTPEALRRLQESALLAIKVLDGATGSGHMLIGGGRRLARHLARIRSGDDEPAPEALRNAMRDVVRHCLYGVDLNDMAVELCKVALWMESMEPGKPLSFLDAHIQCGNSLIGVTPGLDIGEIPDDAFQPVTGDDRATATALRKRNKKEREGQIAFQFGSAETAGSAERHAGRRAQMVAAIENLSEDAVGQVLDKERSYAGYLESTEYKWARWEADTWTAAFFWPILAGDGWAMPAPTQQVLQAVRENKLKQHEGVLRDVRRIAKAHKFFHWALQFPDVFQRENGGFDVELMNPPWEKINLKDEEFFAVTHPAIASAATKAIRKQLIDRLTAEEPDEYQRYIDEQAFHDQMSLFFRYSTRFPSTGVSRINLYSVFAELASDLLSPSGRSGLVIASGIATDDNNKALFEHLVRERRLVAVWDFENREAIFPGVHRMYKFCLFFTRGTSGTNLHADFVFFLINPEQLREKDRHFTLTIEELRSINPNSRTAPTFRNQHDAEIVKSIYKHVDAWCLHTEPDTWLGIPKTPFNMSNDSGLFVDEKSLSEKGFRIDDLGCGRNGSHIYLPLYESKLIHQFNHRYSTFFGLSRSEIKVGNAVELQSHELSKADCTVRGRYWINFNEQNQRFPGNWFLAYRMITNATNERTALATIIPPRPASHSLTIIVDLESDAAAVMCATMNSFVYDFTARQKVAGTNFNHWIWKQLPVPAEAQIVSVGADVFGHRSMTWVLSRVLELTYTAWDLQPFAVDCGYDGPPFRWDEERRFLLRCELDAAYFHLYGIARDDVDYILETFPIVKRKDSARHGEYRTKRVILEMYDAMAEAMATGVAYQTRLDPPPADARVAHSTQESM